MTVFFYPVIHNHIQTHTIRVLPS